MKSKKVLILYTSIGMGHKSIAENIGYELQQGGYEVKLEDIAKVQKGKFEHIITVAHRFVNDHAAFVWGFLYRYGHYIILPFRLNVAAFNYKNTKKLLDEFKPDLVITTQTQSSAIIAYLKKKKYYNNLFGIAFSDYHLHPYWFYKQADFYLANTEEQKQEMVRQDISQPIFVCGMVLKPKTTVNTDEIKNKLGIDSSDKVILISSGSLGTGLNVDLISQFSNQRNIKVIVVCGKNREKFEYLSKNFSGHSQVKVLGFYSPMDELYAISNIYITKPGGLSMAEALRWGLPILISHMLPGQEIKNYNYLISKNLILPTARNIFASALNEITTGKFAGSLKDNPERGKLFKRGATLEAAEQMLKTGV